MPKFSPLDHAPREFHVARDARDHYQFDLDLFTLIGNVVFANFRAARVFAQKMNDKRDLVTYPERAVKAGQINAMGLIDEILHLVVAAYRQQVNPHVMSEALAALEARFGQEAVDTTLLQFASEFPALAVYRGEDTTQDFLQGTTEGVPNRELALEEMLMLWVANLNPAFSPFLELFDDTNLEEQTSYPELFTSLQAFFAQQPAFDGGEARTELQLGTDAHTLIDLLRLPAIASPNSLAGQLAFIRDRWGHILSKEFLRVLGSLDVIAEEEKVIFAGGGPGPAEVYQFAGMEADPERFTLDREWMPRLVLLAKNAFVWLDQLSKRYDRPITTLDQIPDEELDTLAQRGFTGLWLIGLWERSVASRRIKEIMGNADAVASAYSLDDYSIAHDLGGEAAVQNLRERAWARGIRLASDMVPNHMGIDSRWVIERPDWFLQLDYSPYPSYSFNGPDLSPDGRVGIYLEDHYYNHTDAAVVFKRVDRSSGHEQYIYHGNDGTSMPWNDTAQLNFLLPEVREVVIQTILNVARQFPIIRFDAAMVLAKRHIQRLWFPEPGSGGAIASRAGLGMTKAEFDALMPQEFWREVVDRAAVEAPDTLLLAEAFWMLEGYFVRTLGMHRVYNSAFMNMLRDEENAKYRSVMKNTLEFDPEILRRYVNFLNNPDERTAVEQFGKEDKYFAVTLLMSTLPGLPMYGHGQVEGFTEKYGMEYRRAYYDEQPDGWLIDRHAREVFPLLHRRYLFAGVEHFLMYDFHAPDGGVNEDVFAYSNGQGDERALVVIHNKYAMAHGWIKTSVPFSVRTGQGDERALIQRSLGEGLRLRGDDGFYYIFREQVSGLEYIRSGNELVNQGFYIELEAYKSRVFLDFREVYDADGSRYGRLAASLHGRGVPSIADALRELYLQPIHEPLTDLVNADLMRRLSAVGTITGDGEDIEPLLDEVEAKATRALAALKTFANGNGDEQAIAKQIRAETAAALALPSSTGQDPAAIYLQEKLIDVPATWGTLFSWIFTHRLGQVVAPDDTQQSVSGIDEWMLPKVVRQALFDLGLDEGSANTSITLLRVLVAHSDALVATGAPAKRAHHVLQTLLQDNAVHQFLQVNRYNETLYYNQEAFNQLLWWLLAASAVETSTPAAAPTPPVVPVKAVSTASKQAPTASRTKALATPMAPATPSPSPSNQLSAAYAIVETLQQAEQAAEYQVDKLLAAAKA